MIIYTNGKLEFWGITRLALYNVYENAFNSDVRTIKIEKETCIKDVEEHNWENCLIYVNGFIQKETYKIKDGDFISIREFPSALSTGAIIAITIGSLVAGYAIADGINVLCGNESWTKRLARSIVKWALGDTESATNNQQEDFTNYPTISGAKNQSALGSVIPLVLGKTLYTPRYIGKPYTTIGGEDGKDVYFHCLYLLGQSDLQVEDVSLGIYKISANNGEESSVYPSDNYDKSSAHASKVDSGELGLLYGTNAHYDPEKYGIKLELQQGDSEVSLYNQKVVQTEYNTELLHPHGDMALDVYSFSAKYPQKVELEVQFNGLIGYTNEGAKKDATVKLGVQMSVDGGETWIPFVSFNGSQGSVENGYAVSTFTRQKNETLRFVATKEFSYDEIKNCNNGNGIKNDVVEFKIVRLSEKSEESNIADSAFFTNIRTWCYDNKKTEEQHVLVPQVPMIEKYRNHTTRLGFQIKAGDEIQGQLKSLNCIVTSRARIVQDGFWTKETYPTENPASLALFSMTGDFRDKYAYDIDDTGTHPTSRKIDLDSFADCYEKCDEQRDYGGVMMARFGCNGVVMRKTKSLDLANQILGCCKANIVMRGNKYGVLMDEPRENVAFILNNQNILEQTNSKSFDVVPDGLSVKYISALNDYQQDSFIAKPNDCTIPESEMVIENFELPLVTNPFRAKALALYNLAVRKLRPESWSIKTSVEGNMIEVGSRVSIQNDTISVGIGDGAEIMDLVFDDDMSSIIAIITDGIFEVTDYTKDYGVYISEADGENEPRFIKRKVVFTENGTYRKLTFAEPIDVTSEIKPYVGDIVSFGFFDSIVTDGLCVSKKDNGDLTFSLVFVPYQEGVYTADSGIIDDFDSKVTPPQVSGNAIRESSVTLEQLNGAIYNVATGGDSAFPPDVDIVHAVAHRDEITIICDDNNGGLNNSAVKYIYQINKGNGEWIDIDTTSGVYSFDREVDGYPEKTELDTWRVRVKSVNVYGKESQNWKESTIDTGDYGSWKFDFASNNINVDVVDRTAILNMTVSKRSGTKEIYGDTRFKIQIKRIGYVIDGGSGLDTPVSIEDSAYFKPELYKTCYPQGVAENGDYIGNENNYKAEEGGFFDSPNRYSQSLPLYGQEKYQYVFSSDGVNWYADEGMTVPFELPAGVEPKRVATSNKYYILTGKHIQNTSYMYSIVAYNESGFESENPVEIMITAMCTSIRDIVYAHTYYKNLYVEKLSAINANIGMISQGGFGEFSNWTNFWALSTLSAEEAGTQNDVIGGSFRVGDNKEYIMVIPAHSTVGGITNNTDTAMIKIKAGNITLTTSGTEFNSGTYIYDENDENKRLLLSADGITIEAFRDGRWVTVGQFTVDKSGNLLLTNTVDRTNMPKTGIEVNAEIYHFDDDLLAENGTDPLNIQTDGVINSDGSNFIEGRFLQGDVEFNITSLDNQVTVLNKGNALKIGNSYIYDDGTVIANYNGLINGSWGFGANIPTDLFKTE